MNHSNSGGYIQDVVLGGYVPRGFSESQGVLSVGFFCPGFIRTICSTPYTALDPERQFMGNPLTGDPMMGNPGLGMPPNAWVQHMREKQEHEIRMIQIQVAVQ